MVARDYRTEARRWVKFPATVLFGTGVLWLLHRYFQFDMVAISEQTKTGIGALSVIINFLVIPLGCVIVALGLLFLLRWSLWLGMILPVFPLVIITSEKVARIQAKFASFRAENEHRSFGDGVETALLVIALWAVYVVMVLYIWKAWKILNASQEWLSRRRASESAAPEPVPSASQENIAEDDEFCSLLPDLDEETG